MKPGIHDGIPEADYHADPALSQSRAKVLLDSPAKFKWQLDNPQEPREAFDIGHAAHAIVLGIGSAIHVIEATDWRAKATKEEASDARSHGLVPLLRKDADAVDRMAEAVLMHPTARLILEREGDVEQSAWWVDHATDGTPIECRARFDKITTTIDGQPALVDLKTSAKSVAPQVFAKSVVDYGYDLQDDFYSSGVEILTGQRPTFTFITVEKDPPHLVAVHTLDEFFKERGARLRRDALDLYAACLAADEWPGHGNDIHVLTPPRWAS